MSFDFSHNSIVNMVGLAPALPPVVRLALTYSTVDFGVICGLRSVTAQKAAVAAGKSKTMQSRHLTGHAVDLGAYAGGKLDWSPDLYYRIAAAMKRASITLKTPIVWGSVWDRILSDLGDDLHAEVAAYRSRQAAKGNTKPLIDMDHFELSSKFYP